MSESSELRMGRTRLVSVFAVGFAALFVALLAVLHFLNPQIDPSRIMISYYELGNFGFLMSLAFCSLGASVALVAISLHRLGLAGLSLPKVWYCLVALALIGASVFFPYDDGGIVSTLHTLCGVFVIFSSPILSTLVCRVLVKKHGLKIGLLSLGNWLNWLGLVAYMGSTIVLTIIAGTKVGIQIGWQNRAMMVLYSFWLIAVGLNIFRGRLGAKNS